jgi:hypothetical protein
LKRYVGQAVSSNLNNDAKVLIFIITGAPLQKAKLVQPLQRPFLFDLIKVVAPRGRREPQAALEGSVEGSFGLVSYLLTYARQGHFAAAQVMRGDLDSPAR